MVMLLVATLAVQVTSSKSFHLRLQRNATDVGDLTVSRYLAAGQSSNVSGYTSGGFGSTNTIDKFPFASDVYATDVGDLTVIKISICRAIIVESGYTSGGLSTTDTIDKFPFSSTLTLQM